MFRTTRTARGLTAALSIALAASAAPAIAVEVHRDGVVYLDANASPISQLSIELDKTTVVRPGFPVRRVSVGNPEIADVIVTSPSEISVVARASGETNVVIWDQTGKPRTLLGVDVGRPKNRLEALLAKHLPGEEIHVDSSKGSIVLSGTVSSTQAMQSALALAGTMVSDDPTAPEAGDAPQGDARARDRVVNLMRVAGQHQVMIDVAVAEMSRSISRRISTNFAATIGDASSNVQFFSFLNNLTSLDENGDIVLSDRVNLAGSVFNAGDGAGNLFMELLEGEGLSKILAQPTVVARSGETANFLVGGEIPIPVAQGGAYGSVTVLFKPFGISVQFTPTVLSKDQIHLQIAPEVSEPDYTMGSVIAGFLVPAFRTRRAATGVDLRDGESFAIAGLLSDDIVESVEKLPVLGDVPVLGALFRSSQFQHEETELVLVVTPHLVEPLPGRPGLPTDHFTPPSAAEFYLLGRLEAAGAETSAPTGSGSDTAGLVGPVGYRVTPIDEFGGEQ
jgi:pilus assembly protein CpaC